MHDPGESDLLIGAGSCRTGSGIEPGVDQILLQNIDEFFSHKHHTGQGLADNAVQGNQDRERDQGPDAAGHRVDSLFLVELLHLLIQLLLIPFVPPLQLLDLRLDTRGAHHAAFTLRHKRSQHQVDHKSKEDNRPAVVSGDVV